MEQNLEEKTYYCQIAHFCFDSVMNGITWYQPFCPNQDLTINNPQYSCRYTIITMKASARDNSLILHWSKTCRAPNPLHNKWHFLGKRGFILYSWWCWVPHLLLVSARFTERSFDRSTHIHLKGKRSVIILFLTWQEMVSRVCIFSSTCVIEGFDTSLLTSSWDHVNLLLRSS